MTDIHPYPTVNETLGINELVGYVSSVTSGMFFPLILFAMFIIIFVGTMTFGNGRAFVFASFFTSILAIFFAVAEILNPMYMYLSFVLLGISLMMLRISKGMNNSQI
jgi:hypothetical protein